MSDFEDSDDGEKKAALESFAFLSKIKSNTPRARFDIDFFATSIKLTQYSVKKEISNQYRIHKENVIELLRLPYNDGKQFFIVLHLKNPVIGGNKSFTKYDFIVFSFLKQDYEDIKLDLSDPIVKSRFSEDDDSLDNISGKTVDIFETLIVKIFEKSVTTPAKNYIGNKMAPGLQCTFWDNDEHFLYPLDKGFLNVWKYCQKLKLDDVKNVRFIRSKGRSKTFDFVIYPKMERTIRRYHIGSNESRFVHCSSLEFQAIDQKHYEGLYDYCQKNEIIISINDFKESASEGSSSSSSDSDNESLPGTQIHVNSGSDGGNHVQNILHDIYEAPDPHLTRCRSEGDENDSESTTGSEENSDTSGSEHGSSSDQSLTAESHIDSQKATVSRGRRKNISDDTDESSTSESQINSQKKIVFRARRKNISDDTDQSSTSESEMDSQKTISFRGRRKKIISDDSDSDSSTNTVNLNRGKFSLRKRSLRIESDDEIQSKLIRTKT